MSDFIKVVTADSFENDVLKSDVPVLLDFWAPWCGPCKSLNPVIDELAEEFKDGRAIVAKVNVDEHQDLMMQFGLRGIPALLVFNNGEMVENVSQVRTLSSLKSVLDGQAAGQSVNETVMENLEDVTLRFQFMFENDIADVRKLLEQNPNYATEVNGDNLTPSAFAIMEQRADLHELFLEYGATPCAAEFISLKQYDKAKALITQDKAQLESVNPIFGKPLLAAIRNNDLELVKELLAMGAELNWYQDDEPTENIMFLASLGSRAVSEELLEFLIAEGLDVKQVHSGNGHNAIHSTVYMYRANSVSWIKRFAELGVDPKLADKDGKTALDLARESDDRFPEKQELVAYLESLA